MIRYKLKKLLEIKSEKEGRHISASELAKEIGIQRSAMNKMIRDEGYSTTIKTLDALCRYFDCEIEDVIWFDRDSTYE